MPQPAPLGWHNRATAERCKGNIRCQSRVVQIGVQRPAWELRSHSQRNQSQNFNELLPVDESSLIAVDVRPQVAEKIFIQVWRFERIYRYSHYCVSVYCRKTKYKLYTFTMPNGFFCHFHHLLTRVLLVVYSAMLQGWALRAVTLSLQRSTETKKVRIKIRANFF